MKRNAPKETPTDAHAPQAAGQDTPLARDGAREWADQIDDALDRERLMVALKSVYPVSLSVNLTTGEYRVLGGAELFTILDVAEGSIEALVQKGAERMLPEYRAAFIEKFGISRLREAFASGSAPVRMEYRQRAHDGRMHWFECVGLSIDNAYGDDVIGIMLIRFFDEQKAAEEKLRQALAVASGELSREREYLRIIDSSIPVGTKLFLIDDVGTLLHIGGTLQKTLGYSREEFSEFQNNHLRGLVYEPDYGTAFQDMHRYMQQPTASFEQEFRVYRKDGSVIWIYEKGTLVHLGDEPAYIVVWLDVTQRKEMEERIRVSEEEMSLAMSRMGKMICLYDVETRTLTMPEEYAEKHGLPPVLTNVPQSISEIGLLGGNGNADLHDFYHAIQRGEKTGTAEAFMRCADGSFCWERAEFVSVFDRDGKPVKAIIALEDVTLKHKLDDENEALRESERVFRVVAAHSNRLIYRYDIATRTAYADEGMAERVGAQAIGLNMPEGSIERGDVLPDSVEDYRRIFRELHEGKPEGSAKLHIRFANGGQRWVDMRYTLVEAEGKAPTTAVISFQDITQTHERELAYERYRQMILDESATERIVYFETDLTSDVVEKRGGNIPGLSFPEDGCNHEDVVRYGIEHLLPQEARRQAWALFSRERLLVAFADGERSFSQDLPVELPDGERCWFRAEIQMIRDPYSSHIKVYTSLHDVTEETVAALEVRKQAETDGMTGLYNKAMTEQLVRSRLAAASGKPCALLIADLDNLKSINDSMGHGQGDRAIREMAAVLKGQFRHTDIVGRIGGDEFLAFLDGVGDESMMQGVMMALMRRITRKRIGENSDVELRGSVGVAFGTTGHDSFEELYRKADRALYHVKRNGKNDYAFYKPEMEKMAYQYEGHDESSFWEANAFDRQELDRLLHAVSELYPLVISVNLTKNSYYMMRCDRFTTSNSLREGEYDDLIAEGETTFHPEDRQSFADTFSRESLLAAHAGGERSVTHVGRQLGDDGVYHNIRTDVVFVPGEGDDVMEITLAREFVPGVAKAAMN